MVVCTMYVPDGVDDAVCRSMSFKSILSNAKARCAFRCNHFCNVYGLKDGIGGSPFLCKIALLDRNSGGLSFS